MEQRLKTVNLVEFWGLPPLIPLLTENVAKDTFKGSLFGCFEYVPYTALTVV